jgi:hypothetical protein
MLFRRLFLSILLSALASMTWSQTLVLAKDLRIEMPDSALVAHSGDSVIFKYDDWVMNHHILDPKFYFPSIDLTGWMNRFVEHMFGKKDSELPEWMGLLAKNHAEALDISEKSTVKLKSNGKVIYAAYSGKFDQAHIFLLNDGYINYFNVLSDKQKYLEFLELLKE